MKEISQLFRYCSVFDYEVYFSKLVYDFIFLQNLLICNLIFFLVHQKHASGARKRKRVGTAVYAGVRRLLRQCLPPRPHSARKVGLNFS